MKKRGGHVFDVIIVEDKKITREGLSRLVDWQSIGGYITAAFEGANPAIAHIARHHVDLVVTDISMPDGTGLDLLAYVQQNRPEIKVIIISAYEKFSYAHQALSMGASAYLLKPVNDEELLHHARRVFDEIERRDRVQTQASFIRWSKVADEIGRSLADRTMEQLRAPLADFQSSFDPAGATFLYFRTYGEKLVSCQHLREIAAETGQPVFLLPADNGMLCILSGTLTLVQEVLQILLQQWKLQPPYRFGVSLPAAEGLAAWPDAFRQAKAAFAHSFWRDAPSEIWCFTEGDPLPGNSTAAHLDYAELKKHLWSDNLAAAMEHLNAVAEFCRENDCDAATAASSFASTLCRLYDTCGIPEQDPGRLQRGLAACSTGQALQRMVGEELRNCFRLSSEQKARVVRPIVKLAQEYSIKHISNPDLNLKAVAQKIGVSYVYLSKAFKEDFQQGYSEYISQYRIELAKDYLLEPYVHVYEVCSKVGLEPKNFHGLFKKYTGMTPKTYQAKNVQYGKYDRD